MKDLLKTTKTVFKALVPDHTYNRYDFYLKNKGLKQ